ncbi:MAG: SDR family oxidoreductase [Candidatus Rokubacteria bacterium]|nr:SDR family oxidoreductase [Candidatus Rokubacteria bacterium]
MIAAPVLLTGATGFIGREVARRLLAAGRPVLALARGKEGEPAPDRVANALGCAPDGRHLGIIEGDLALPGCGLAASDWARLRSNVETVIHCAGETTFFPDDLLAFRQGHIDGPVALLHGLRGGRLRRWAHLSTAYVCGRRAGRVLESEGDLGQEFHNPYERVKLEAEGAVRRVGARLGVDVRVLRPSIVVGPAPATAGGTPANLFFDFIRLAARLARLADGTPVPLRIHAAPRARFNIVPLEYVAAAVVALAEHPGGVGETVHLVVSEPPTQEKMLDLITGRLGLRGLSLVDPGWLVDPSPLEGMVARMLSGYREYLQQDVRFDDSTARRVLGVCRVTAATLPPQAVHQLIDQALVKPMATRRFHAARRPDFTKI